MVSEVVMVMVLVAGWYWMGLKRMWASPWP